MVACGTALTAEQIKCAAEQAHRNEQGPVPPGDIVKSPVRRPGEQSTSANNLVQPVPPHDSVHGALIYYALDVCNMVWIHSLTVLDVGYIL